MNTTGTGQANSTFDTQAHNINKILLLHILNPEFFYVSQILLIGIIFCVTYFNQWPSSLQNWGCVTCFLYWKIFSTNTSARILYWFYSCSIKSFTTWSSAMCSTNHLQHFSFQVIYSITTLYSTHMPNYSQ